MLLVTAVFMVLLLIGMPVAFAIGISGVVFFLQNPNLPITIPIQLSISQTQNFALLAVPMFILAGPGERPALHADGGRFGVMHRGCRHGNPDAGP
jgi:TRAP-type mannitol/chloroaromatic compound transport system permease large subunit